MKIKLRIKYANKAKTKLARINSHGESGQVIFAGTREQAKTLLAKSNNGIEIEKGTTTENSAALKAWCFANL